MQQLCARPLNEEDLDHIGRWLTDERVFKNLYMLCHPMPAGELLDWYRQERASGAQLFLFFARENTTAPVGLGLVHYIHPKNRCGELSILISPDCFNQGFGRRILDYLLRYSFDVLNLHKLFVHCVAYNRPMIAILAKSSFVQEGVFRSELYFGGDYHDIYRYGLLAAEYYSS